MIWENLCDFLLTAGSIIFVLVALGFCIVSHEFGHFIAAKLLGLHVDSFALGFRPFFRKKYRGVEYRIGYLPFGGYCEIPQIDATGDTPVAADGTELQIGPVYAPSSTPPDILAKLRGIKGVADVRVIDW